MCFSLLYFPLKELSECDYYILPSNSITHVVIEIHINRNTIQISFFITLKRTQGGWPWSIVSQVVRRADILGSYSNKQTLHYKCHHIFIHTPNEQDIPIQHFGVACVLFFMTDHTWCPGYEINYSYFSYDYCKQLLKKLKCQHDPIAREGQLFCNISKPQWENDYCYILDHNNKKKEEIKHFWGIFTALWANTRVADVVLGAQVK